MTKARRCSVGLLAVAQWKLAQVLLRTNGLRSRAAIEVALAESSRLSREADFRLAEPLLCVERAELARLNGDQATRDRELREAYSLFIQIGAPVPAAEIAKKLGLATVS